MLDIIIIFLILLIAALVFKRLDNTLIFLGLIDVFFRIMHYIGEHTTQTINNLISDYIPSSLPGVIAKYSSGILETILIWVYIVIMIMFVYYVLKMLIHRL